MACWAEPVVPGPVAGNDRTAGVGEAAQPAPGGPRWRTL